MGMFEVKKGKEILELTGNYKGGYANVGMSGSLKCKIKEDKLVFSQLWKTYHVLDIKDITDVHYKSEQEISKDVTLTRLLAVGILAFGLKKKRVANSYYIIINTLEDGFSNDFVLELDNTIGMGTAIAQGFVKTLRNRVIKYKSI